MFGCNASLERYLLTQTPLDVDTLEGIETGQDTGTGDTTEDVSSGSLHHGHEAFVLEDLNGAIHGVLVFDGGTRGHHHSSTNGVNGVGHKTGGNGDTPAEQEGQENVGVLTQQDGLQGVVETEVHATVDEDTDARNDEATVQTLDTVRFQGLGVDIDEAVELTVSATLLGRLGVVSQTSTSVIERVDEQEGHGTGAASRNDVHAELANVAGILGGGEGLLDGILEGEVQSLGREVTEDVGEVTAPESEDAFAGHGTAGTIDDAIVGFVEDTLLDHLALILDEELNTLDGSSGSLGHTSGNTGEHEVLEKGQCGFLSFIRHFGFYVMCEREVMY